MYNSPLIEKFKDIRKELQSSPLYQLSLTNKELFHSNFLAWFGDTHPALFVKLIKLLLNKGDIGLEGGIIVKREYNHFDISVFEASSDGKTPGRLRIVIENKIKSIPTQTQLDEYEKKINEVNGIELILLTMNEQCKEWTSKNESIAWKLVDYNQLCSRLSEVSKDVTDSYHKALLADYCNYAPCLQKAIDLSTGDKKFYYNKEEYELLRELGIHDVCGKRKVQSVHLQLLDAFRRKEEDGQLTIVGSIADLKSGKRQIQLNWTYTNAPVLEVRFKTRFGDFVIIQIQGGQYRHAVEFFDKKIGKRISQTEGRFGPSDEGKHYLEKHYPRIFGKDAINDYPRLDNKKPEFGQKSRFCKYCNGKVLAEGISCFVYQWIPLPESMKIGDLVQAIVQDTLCLLESTAS